jgi:hypothetical protein
MQTGKQRDRLTYGQNIFLNTAVMLADGQVGRQKKLAGRQANRETD